MNAKEIAAQVKVANIQFTQAIEALAKEAREKYIVPFCDKYQLVFESEIDDRGSHYWYFSNPDNNCYIDESLDGDPEEMEEIYPGVGAIVEMLNEEIGLNNEQFGLFIDDYEPET